MNIVFTGILNDKQIVGLENPKPTLADMGLLKSGESGENDIKESEKNSIPRFLNQLLSLEIQRQNTLFDYFYQTFNESFDLLAEITQENISIIECLCYEKNLSANDSCNERILDWAYLPQHPDELCLFGFFDRISA